MCTVDRSHSFDTRHEILWFGSDSEQSSSFLLFQSSAGIQRHYSIIQTEDVGVLLLSSMLSPLTDNGWLSTERSHRAPLQGLTIIRPNAGAGPTAHKLAPSPADSYSARGPGPRHAPPKGCRPSGDGDRFRKPMESFPMVSHWPTVSTGHLERTCGTARDFP